MSILKIAAICFAALLALEANADVACPEKFNGNYRWVSAERGTFLTESVQISIKLEKACSSINIGWGFYDLMQLERTLIPGKPHTEDQLDGRRPIGNSHHFVSFGENEILETSVMTLMNDTGFNGGYTVVTRYKLLESGALDVEQTSFFPASPDGPQKKTYQLERLP